MDPTAANKETIAKVTAWLDKRKASITPERAVVIQSLIDNLEFSNLHFEELNRGEKFIIVPVSDNFKSQNNKSKKSITNAVFILTETNTIGEGNIVIYSGRCADN